MPALDHSWIALTALSLASVLCGYGLRHLLSRHTDRASARRISALCDQLDLKDGKLHGLRAELQAEQARGRDLQSALAARLADPALRVESLEHNEEPTFFKRRVRALEGKPAATAQAHERFIFNGS